MSDYFCTHKQGYGLYGNLNETFHDYHLPSKCEWKSLNVVWKEGETMDVIMYFKKGDHKKFCLGYQNTKDNFENAFDDLDPNLNYRFGAAFYENSTSVMFI